MVNNFEDFVTRITLRWGNTGRHCGVRWNGKGIFSEKGLISFQHEWNSLNEKPLRYLNKIYDDLNCPQTFYR